MLSIKIIVRYFMLSQSNFYTRSVLSNSVKREVLWNVSEPGDPYDIKRSMISKLPGDRRPFMGDHLDLVCLFQAAEIQRLCEFLEDYKLKFREIQRNNLDRHSYQIQIKELTEEINIYESLQAENVKLKEFIKKQGMEIENLNRFSRDNRGLDESFKVMYEQTNERLMQVGLENQQLLEINEEYRMQVQNFNARLEAFERAKNREVEDLRLNYAQFSKESFESSLNAQRYQTQGEIRRLELELKRLKEAYDQKINQNALLIKTNETYAKQLASKDKPQANFLLDDRNREIQAKLVLASAEIQRANISLREIRSRYDQSQMKRLELQRRVERYDFTIRDIQEKLRLGNNQIARLNQVIRQLSGENKKIGESQYIAIQYETKIQELSREREQVISRVQLQVNNSQRLREELQKVQLQNSKYKLIQRENVQLKAEVGDRQNLKRRVIDLQNTLVIKNQQFQRIILHIKNKDAQLERRRSIADENQGLKVRIREVETRLTSKYESDIARLRAEYEQKIAYINQAKGNEYQYKAQNYERQGERLKELLKNKTEEAEKQRSRIYELQHVISRLELQTSSKIKNFQSNFGQMRKETEELYLRARKLEETERKLYEVQSRIVQLEKEQQRLMSVVKGREEELFALRNKLREIQQNAQRFQAQSVRKTNNYQQTISAIRSQNQELRKRINEFVGQSGKKLNEAVQEINRLNTALRGLQLQKTHLDARLKQITAENDNLRQALQKTQRQAEELRSRIAESEARLINVSNESSFNTKRIIGENQSLKQQLNDYKVSIANYEAEVNKRFAGSEQNLTALARENEDLRRRVRDLEGEVDAGGKRFKIKIEELAQLENRFRTFSVDLQNAKRMHMQYQQTIQSMRKESQASRRKASQTELQLKNRIVNYQVQIQNFGRSNQANFNRIRDQKTELERQLDSLAKKHERLVANLNQVLPENEALRKRVENYETSIAAYEGEVNKSINAYEQTIAGLSRERDELVKRLQQDGSETNRLLQESDGKVRNAIQEIAQLNAMLKAKQEQIFRMEQRIILQNQEVQTIRKQCSELQIRFTQTYQIEVTKKYNIYEQTIADLKRRLTEGENRYSITAQELQRLKQILQGRQVELEQSRRSLKDYEVSFNQTIDIQSRNKNDLNRKLAEAENRAIILAQEAERLNVTLKARTEEARRVPELQQRIIFLQQEGQKLQFSLRNLQARSRELGLENQQLRRQASETQLNWAKRYESQVGQQVGKFQTTLTTVTRQRDELIKRRSELQSKLALISQELARTTEELQRARAEIQQLKRNSQRKIEQSQTEANNWQSNYHAIAGQFQSAKKHLQEYQLNIRQLYAEFQRLQVIITDLKKERQVLIEKNHALGEEITRLRAENQDLQGQTRDVRLRLTDETSLQKRINEHMALMVVLFAEIESLRKRISDKQREVQTVRRSSLSPNIV